MRRERRSFHRSRCSCLRWVIACDAVDPNSRTVAIGGRDRAAVMLGGHDAYLTLWWAAGKGFRDVSECQVEAGMRKKIDGVNKDVKTSYDLDATPEVAAAVQGAITRGQHHRQAFSVGELHDTKGQPADGARRRHSTR